jgi:hypothetical protein
LRDHLRWSRAILSTSDDNVAGSSALPATLAPAHRAEGASNALADLVAVIG